MNGFLVFGMVVWGLLLFGHVFLTCVVCLDDWFRLGTWARLTAVKLLVLDVIAFVLTCFWLGGAW